MSNRNNRDSTFGAKSTLFRFQWDLSLTIKNTPFSCCRGARYRSLLGVIAQLFMLPESLKVYGYAGNRNSFSYILRQQLSVHFLFRFSKDTGRLGHILDMIAEIHLAHQLFNMIHDPVNRICQATLSDFYDRNCSKSRFIEILEIKNVCFFVD